MSKMITILMLLISCNISSSDDIFVMQKEDIIGTWYGSTKVESQLQPGYYTDRPVTILIQDQDSASRYSRMDTILIWVSEKIDPNTTAITHTGYITDLREEYEPTLVYTYTSTGLGSKTSYTIKFTQMSEDSMRIQFGTWDYKVRK